MSNRFRDLYKGYSDEAYDAMFKLHSGPLPKDKQPQALKLFAEGMSRENICRQLGVSNSALQISCTYDPEFKKKWLATKSKRVRQVNDKVIESLLQGTLEIRTVKMPVLDENKKP